MQFVALMFIMYFLIGAAVCLLICVNPRDPGVLGKVRSLIFQSLPDAFTSIIRRTCGERVLNCLGGVKYYLAETNHPLVQWFYYIIAVGGFIGYAYFGIFRYMPNKVITTPFVIIAYTLAGICFWTYYKACSVSPGQITKENKKQYVQKHKNSYDGIMYKKDNKCKTCEVIKPARSKHCSVCKMCVSKFDHHCIWVRQCVGEHNYKYFVSFLFTHSIWCSYLSIIGAISLYQFLVSINFWNRQYRVGAEIVRGSNFLALQYVFVLETLFFFLIIMCAIMGFTLFIFVSYHFYLISQNQTTNERVKKGDYIDYLKKQQKNFKNFIKNNDENIPDEIIFNGEKMSKKQFEEYHQDINYRLSVLTKPIQNLGFFHNLKVVFRTPDK